MIKTILIVDDQAKIRKLVRMALSEKFNVLEASNGAAALEIIGSEHPDLVLLDISMPGINGFQVLGCVKNELNPALKTVKFIILTASSDDFHHDLSYKYGVERYILKPFRPSVLRAIVEELLWEDHTHLPAM